MGTFVVSNLVSLQDLLVCRQTERYYREQWGPLPLLLLTIVYGGNNRIPLHKQSPSDNVGWGLSQCNWRNSHRIRKTACRGSRLNFSLHNPELWQRALPADCSARHVAAALGGSFKSYRFFSPHPTLFGWRLGCSVLGLCYLLNNSLL